jgi:formylmethanofuran dehydrogenase subunit C
MKPLVLTLRHYPDQRLDMSPLVSDRLAGLSVMQISAIELQTTRRRVTVRDAFRIRMGDARSIRIEQGCDRLDRIGHAMASGDIAVEGDVGIQAGRLMAAGTLRISGNAGPWAGSAMRGGELTISGDVGERLGGPLPGETVGMRGGMLWVRGNAGERAGDRLRRGTVVIEGEAGPYAGSRMLAGTLIVRRRAGAMPGYLMSRGTIVLLGGTERLPPSFLDCGACALVASRLMANFIEPLSPKIAMLLRKPLRRLAGDMAALGRGEMLLAD